MEYTDRGLWINGASESGGNAVLQAVGTFREVHGLRESAWQIRVYGVCSTRLDVWIGRTPDPIYQPFALEDDDASGDILFTILERLQANYRDLQRLVDEE